MAEWRQCARALVLAETPPETIEWRCTGDDPDLFAEHHPLPEVREEAQLSVPAAFVSLAQRVICHSDPTRFDLLYRLLWRLRSQKRLLEIASDPDVVKAHFMEKSVRRDAHKMTAFVRFKEVEVIASRRRFLAWFEPEHFIVGLKAPFFRNRFADMDWMILTPKGSAGWDGEELSVSDEPCQKPDISDTTDDLWKTYYASIFNPARLKIKAMQAEMPKKYWNNLPEAELIPHLIADAREKVRSMTGRAATEPPVHHHRMRSPARVAPPVPKPEEGTLEAVREEARGCTRCPLYKPATQTVFGEGPERADVMFVGEQPGDQEDLAGRPFVGPAGKVFDQVVQEVGIDRKAVYVTNAVKHFKYEPKGKRRIHQRPNMGEVRACRWWLDLELDLIRPKLVVALGATALASLTDGHGKLSEMRGQVLTFDNDRRLFVTIHPSYLLRIPDRERKESEMARFREDILKIKELMTAD